jgi:hypothetical protein
VRPFQRKHPQRGAEHHQQNRGNNRGLMGRSYADWLYAHNLVYVDGSDNNAHE